MQRVLHLLRVLHVVVPSVVTTSVVGSVGVVVVVVVVVVVWHGGGVRSEITTVKHFKPVLIWYSEITKNFVIAELCIDLRSNVMRVYTQ